MADQTPTTPCPRCGTLVSVLALRCPKCGRCMDRRAIKAIGAVAWGMVIVFMLGMFVSVTGIYSGSATDSPEESQQRRDRVDAIVAAEKCVRRFLKYPRDARLGWGRDCAWNEDRNRVMVTSTVKVKNAFGAELTYDYGVLMIRDDRAHPWRLLECAIGDETVYRSDEIDQLLTEPTSQPNEPEGRGVDGRSELEAPQTAESHKIYRDVLDFPAPSGARPSSNEATSTGSPESRNIYRDVLDSPDQVVFGSRKAPEELIEGQGSAESLPRDPTVRTWTDSSGQYTVEASFVSATMGKVNLRKPEGETIEIPMERLSEPDQRWLQERAKRK